MSELQTNTADEILTTVYKPIEFIIEGLPAQGLYILEGAQKIGNAPLQIIAKRSLIPLQGRA